MQKVWNSFGFQTFEAEYGFDKLSLNEMLEKLGKYVDTLEIQYVFSYNYVPNLAEACYQKGIFYISWTVDAPLDVLWSKTTSYSSNRFFLFDSVQYQKLANRGEENIWHLPLVAKVEEFEQIIANDNEKSKEKFASDVSFLANLYTDAEHSLYDRIRYMPPYLQGSLETLMYVQRQVWGVDLLDIGLSSQVLNLLKQYVKCEWGEDYLEDSYKMSIINILGQKLAQVERKEVCSYLARHFDFALYTGSDTTYDPMIQNRGYADYLKEMPLIFRYSKININITSRSIPSGIPQRVLDVLACKGFLLTNYQPEIEEYFEDGQELVIYTDFQDMYQKIEYYLGHEEERRRIAQNGYKKAKELFCYKKSVGKIIQELEETIENFNQEEEEKISIVIAKTSSAQKLEKAMQNVKSQTYKNWEIIIVDDELEREGNNSVRKNAAIKKAEGTIIAFCDGDSYWHPQKLEKQINYWRKHPAYAMVYSASRISSESNADSFQDRPTEESLEGKIASELLVHNPIGIETVLIRKSAFEKCGGFDSAYNCLAGWDMILRLAKKYSIGYQDEILVETDLCNRNEEADFRKFAKERCKMLAENKEQLINDGNFDRVVLKLFQDAEAAEVLAEVKQMFMQSIEDTEGKM